MKFDKIKKLTDENIFNTYGRQSICFESGKKCKLYDTEGKEYTDFLAGIAVNILGHNDKELVKAIKEQAGFLHLSNLYYSKNQAALAEKLCKAAGMDKAFFCNSGAEANEAAIKLARKYFSEKGVNKYKFITAKNSFHGRTMGSLSATGQEKYSMAFKPLLPGFTFAEYNNFEAFKACCDDETCAIILETIQGEGGVIEAKQEFIDKIYAFTREKGILLIIDEIQTGLGRTGKMFSYMNYGIKPDIITVAKGLAGGLPMGAMLAVKEVNKSFVPGDHGSTFGGNLMAAAAANIVIDKLNNGLIEQAEETGKYFKQKLKSLKSKNVMSVSGQGLMLGVKLNEKLQAKEVVLKMLEKGFIINACGNNTLRFLPPIIISKREISTMVNALTEIIDNM